MVEPPGGADAEARGHEADGEPERIYGPATQPERFARDIAQADGAVQPGAEREKHIEAEPELRAARARRISAADNPPRMASMIVTRCTITARPAGRPA